MEHQFYSHDVTKNRDCAKNMGAINSPVLGGRWVESSFCIQSQAEAAARSHFYGKENLREIIVDGQSRGIHWRAGIQSRWNFMKI